jgi:hypothetical protein
MVEHLPSKCKVLSLNPIAPHPTHTQTWVKSLLPGALRMAFCSA